MTFTPTVDRTVTGAGYPTTCFVCARHAHGAGVGNPSREDPKYLCQECLLLIDNIKTIRAWNGYEKAAVAHAVDAVGPIVAANGTDLSQWDALQVEEFVRAIWLACADGVRAAVKTGVPF